MNINLRAIKATPGIMMILLAFSFSLQAGDPVIHVNKSAAPGGDGTSWPTAFQHLNDALASATGGEEIWVAQGIYYPDEGAGQTDNDPISTFTITNPVSIYGGFDGSEAIRDDRDFVTNLTIFSGDIDQNDNTGKLGYPNSSSDIVGTNAYHIMTWNNATTAHVLDGVILSGGSAYGTDSDDRRGAAITCISGTLTINNTLIQANRSSSRAAIWACNQFIANNSQFIRNHANDVGAITVNSATFDRVDFIGNTTNSQAALFYSAGATYNITNSYMLGNDTNNHGPIRMLGGQLYMENVVASGNVGGEGGLLALLGAANADLVNVTFTGNYGSASGGAIHFNSTGTLNVYNSVIYHNQDNTGINTFSSAIASGGNGTINIANSDVAGTGGSQAWTPVNAIDGGGNIDADPMLLDTPLPTGAPFSGSDHRLTSFSPLINVGNNSHVTTAFDVLEQPRIALTTVDMGAVEAQSVGDVQLVLDTPNASINAGDPLNYTLQVTVPQPSAAHTVHVSNQLSQNISCQWTAQFTGAVFGSSAGNGMIDELYDMPPNSSIDFDIDCESLQATNSLNHTASAALVNGFDINLNDNSGSVDVDVTPHPTDIAVSHSHAPGVTVAGGIIEYQLLIENTTTHIANGVELDYDFDDQLMCTWFINYQGGASGAASNGNGEITGFVINLPGLSTIEIESNCLVDDNASQSVTNTASVVWPGGQDTNSNNDTSQVTAQVIEAADLIIDLTTTASTPQLGDQISFEVYIENNSAHIQNNVTVQLDDPAELGNCTWICLNNSGTTCNDTTAQSGFIDDVISMAPAAEATYGMVCTLNGENSDGQMALTATIASDGSIPDPNLFNNTSRVTEDVIIFKSGFE